MASTAAVLVLLFDLLDHTARAYQITYTLHAPRLWFLPLECSRCNPTTSAHRSASLHQRATTPPPPFHGRLSPCSSTPTIDCAFLGRLDRCTARRGFANHFATPGLLDFTKRMGFPASGHRRSRLSLVTPVTPPQHQPGPFPMAQHPTLLARNRAPGGLFHLQASSQPRITATFSFVLTPHDHADTMTSRSRRALRTLDRTARRARSSS